MRSLLLIALLAACHPPPPYVVSIDGAFDDDQRAVIETAIEAWCPAVGWCPELVEWSSRGRIYLDEDYAEDHRRAHSAGFNDGDNAHIDAHGRALQDLESLWHVAAHEYGHFGIHGHVKSSKLMTSHPGYPALMIDGPARWEWCKQQGC